MLSVALSDLDALSEKALNLTVALGPPPLVKPPQKELAFLGKGSVDEPRRRRFTLCSPSPWLILTPLVERH